jgi:hypothetical protein
MANCCYNSVDIIGTKENISKITDIINSLSEESPIFHGLFKHLSEEEFKSDNWYLQNISNISNLECIFKSDSSIDINEYSINWGFDSRWSPPISELVKLSEVYNVNIIAYYEESGSDFCGITKIDNNGNVISQNEYSYIEGKYRFCDGNLGFFYESCIASDIEDYIEDNGDFDIDTYFRENFDFKFDEKDLKVLISMIEDDVKEYKKRIIA